MSRKKLALLLGRRKPADKLDVTGRVEAAEKE
jgi:hypothetical protein